MDRFTYLIIDLGALTVPFLFSFHPKLRFDRELKYYLPAMFIVAIPFLVWDQYFTSIGIWGFNPDYLSGLYIGQLPIEEILFFLCIPYACVFSYHCFIVGKFNKISSQSASMIIMAICVVLVIILLFHFGKYYTTSTFVLLVGSLIYLTFVRRAEYIKDILFAYTFLQVPFFITNGLLTGSWIDEAIVWYNDTENIGYRIATIPFEDTFYGMLLILWNIALYEWIKKRYSKTSTIG
ncbi:MULTISPECIES: lycopene cyclase domain-containing protein [Reichenbachiella]|uniref:Lycopene cyclase domain-containing protein n=1 Tax=Reichenbachiella agariperforans TaxID=156994 RepID=A0A1M6K9H8_REIAG|nr:MULTISPECIES: lycopene cyclase domain-containing protein [Reichenbachiella]RJE74561.1 hypothetical protein BGP76_15570 [Reichenbachiella sp. MSK19-1]SHJ55550.1 lycopene cyclase domain-containing protein [Reichenbachiella agariperforans]